VKCGSHYCWIGTTAQKISNIGHCTGRRIEAPKAPRSSAKGARIEAPKAPKEVECGEGVSPSPLGVESGEGPRKFLDF